MKRSNAQRRARKHEGTKARSESRWSRVPSIGNHTLTPCLHAFMLLILLLIVGCNATPQVIDGSEANDETPSYAEIAERHNERVERLHRIYARGNIEFHWRENRRSRREQGDLDFYLVLPRQTAFRVSKLGETYYWFGSDDTRYWLFDLADRNERVAHVAKHDSPVLAGDFVLPPPLVVLDLMGVTPIPGEPPVNGSVVWSGDHDAWTVTLPRGDAEMRLFLEPDNLLPVRVELHSLDRDAMIYSTIQRHQSVSIRGVSAASLPRMGTLIDIEAVADEADDDLDGFIKIALTRPSGDIDEDTKQRIFDLDRLIQAHRPHRIEGDEESRDGLVRAQDGEGR